MPVFNKNPNDLFKAFVDHINRILSKTITRYPLYWDTFDSNIKALMQFSGLQKIPISDSEFRFTIAQVLIANIDHGVKSFRRQYRLETHEYHYCIWKNDAPDPIIRFEYDRRLKEEAGHCRHHCHILLKCWGLNFNRIHIPTGWVLIEDLIRFIIVDLGCQTLSTRNDCLNELASSEELFFVNRSSKEINPQNLKTQ